MPGVVLDLDELLNRVSADKALALELCEMFLEDFRSKRPIFDKALVQDDFKSFKNTVHSLKGAAGNIAAKALHQSLVDLEKELGIKDKLRIKAEIESVDGDFLKLSRQIIEIRNYAN